MTIDEIIYVIYFNDQNIKTLVNKNYFSINNINNEPKFKISILLLKYRKINIEKF